MDSSIPVEVWVGPSGSTAQGRVAQLALLADSLGVSIGSSIGKTGDMSSQALTRSSYQAKIEILRSSTLQWNEAIEANLVQCDRVEIDELGKTLTEKEQLARCANPTLGDFLVNRDSFVSEVIQTDDGPRLSPLTKTKINRLNLIDQLMHTVASPPITYLLLVSGLALCCLNFFNRSRYSGSARCYFGLAKRIWINDSAISVMGFIAYNPFNTRLCHRYPNGRTKSLDIDRSSNVHNRDNILYYETNVEMSWIPMSVGIVGVLVLMARGMPIMIRGRFATTQINRQ